MVSLVGKNQFRTENATGGVESAEGASSVYPELLGPDLLRISAALSAREGGNLRRGAAWRFRCARAVSRDHVNVTS